MLKLVIVVYLFKFSVVCPQMLQFLPVLIYPVGLRQLHMYSFSLERLLQQVLPVPRNLPGAVTVRGIAKYFVYCASRSV